MLGQFQGWQLIILLVLILLLFGYKRLPDATRSIGRSLRIFKSEVRGMDDDEKRRTEDRVRDRDDVREDRTGGSRAVEGRVLDPEHDDVSRPRSTGTDR